MRVACICFSLGGVLSPKNIFCEALATQWGAPAGRNSDLSRPAAYFRGSTMWVAIIALAMTSGARGSTSTSASAASFRRS